MIFVDNIRKLFHWRNLRSVPYIIRRLHLNAMMICSNVLMSLRCYFWQVKIGRNCRFFGLLTFDIHPQSSSVVIGNNCVFRSHWLSNTIGLKQRCFISTGARAEISIGSNCGFSGTVINAYKYVSIGNNVFCGANVTICDNDRHPVLADERVAGAIPIGKEIQIKDNVWIGMNTLVLKGSIVGANSVIAANSVVTGEIPANVLAGGIPARIIRFL